MFADDENIFGRKWFSHGWRRSHMSTGYSSEREEGKEIPEILKMLKVDMLCAIL